MGKQLLLDEVQFSANLLTREASSLVADRLFELRAKVHPDITEGSLLRIRTQFAVFVRPGRVCEASPQVKVEQVLQAAEG
ncbi:MAG: hypothetical protein QOH31_5724 [Verrucomicrobiota bacterium]|jgi:hypothetical protein